MTFSSFRNIHLCDTDAAGVLYFAKGLTICHETYEAWLDSLGLSIGQMIRDRTIALPIVHAEIDYFRPIQCSDRLKIKLELQELEQTKFAIAYSFFNSDSPDKLLAKALTVHVCIDPKTRQRATLPSKILEA